MYCYYTDEQLEELFPCLGEEGQDVYPSDEAIAVARRYLKLEDEDLLMWHLPDVFSVRYGSSYVGTAKGNGKELLFHSDEGDFEIEDRKLGV